MYEAFQIMAIDVPIALDEFQHDWAEFRVAVPDGDTEGDAVDYILGACSLVEMYVARLLATLCDVEVGLLNVGVPGDSEKDLLCVMSRRAAHTTSALADAVHASA